MSIFPTVPICVLGCHNPCWNSSHHSKNKHYLNLCACLNLRTSSTFKFVHLDFRCLFVTLELVCCAPTLAVEFSRRGHPICIQFVACAVNSMDSSCGLNIVRELFDNQIPTYLTWLASDLDSHVCPLAHSRALSTLQLSAIWD